MTGKHLVTHVYDPHNCLHCTEEDMKKSQFVDEARDARRSSKKVKTPGSMQSAEAMEEARSKKEYKNGIRITQ